MRRGRLLLLALLAVPTGCAKGVGETAPLPDLDEPFFRCHVRPVLVKGCAGFACHGKTERYFRIVGRNRLRLKAAEEERNSALSTQEAAFDFDSARAYVNESAPESSWLLMKPLDQKAGGYYHGGAILFSGGDVFLSKDEPDYQVLLGWARGAKETAECIEPGSLD
jgi:hypothetical protein